MFGGTLTRLALDGHRSILFVMCLRMFWGSRSLITTPLTEGGRYEESRVYGTPLVGQKRRGVIRFAGTDKHVSDVTKTRTTLVIIYLLLV